MPLHHGGLTALGGDCNFHDAHAMKKKQQNKMLSYLVTFFFVGTSKIFLADWPKNTKKIFSTNISDS